MMKWRCACCGAVVDEPLIRERWENMDGENGWMLWREAFCPECGDEQIYDFEEVEDEDEDAYL